MLEFTHNHLLETLSFRMISNEEQCKVACFHWFNSFAKLQIVCSEFLKGIPKQSEFSASKIR